MLADKITQDLTGAMKARDTVRMSILRFLKAALANDAISKKTDKLDDAAVIEVIRKLIKQHEDSIEGFKKGNRDDLVSKETQELEILKSYCPPEAGREEILGWVREAVKESGAQGPQDLGKVMKRVMSKAKGKANGKRVNALALEVLGGKNDG